MPFTRLGDLCCHRDQVLSQCVLPRPGSVQPGDGPSSVGECFFCGEGFGANDKQRGLRIQPNQRSVQIIWVDVGHKITAERRSFAFECVTNQSGAQIRAADPQINHGGEPFAGKTD